MIYNITTQVTETKEVVQPFNTEMHHYRKTKNGDGIAAYINGAILQVHPMWGYMASDTGLHLRGIQSFITGFPLEATEEEFMTCWKEAKDKFSYMMNHFDGLMYGKQGVAIPDWEVQILSAITELLQEKQLNMWSDIEHLNDKILLPNDGSPKRHLYQYNESEDNYFPAGFIFCEVNSIDGVYTVSINYRDTIDNITHGVRFISKLDTETAEKVCDYLISIHATCYR